MCYTWAIDWLPVWQGASPWHVGCGIWQHIVIHKPKCVHLSAHTVCAGVCKYSRHASFCLLCVWGVWFRCEFVVWGGLTFLSVTYACTNTMRVHTHTHFTVLWFSFSLFTFWKWISWVCTHICLSECVSSYFMCVCAREREREKVREKESMWTLARVCLCTCIHSCWSARLTQVGDGACPLHVRVCEGEFVCLRGWDGRVERYFTQAKR